MGPNSRGDHREISEDVRRDYRLELSNNSDQTEIKKLCIYKHTFIIYLWEWWLVVSCLASYGQPNSEFLVFDSKTLLVGSLIWTLNLPC